jgi:hypothetical protein
MAQQLPMASATLVSVSMTLNSRKPGQDLGDVGVCLVAWFCPAWLAALALAKL